MTFCSRHRQTILPKHLPLSLAHQYSSTTSLIRFSVWFLSSILSLSLSSANLHLPLYFNQVALSLYDCLHLPPFQFLFKVFGLRFWFDWLWANTSLDWICRCLYVLQASTKKRLFQTFIQGPTTGFVMLTSCSCCSSLTKCLSRWCAAMLTSGWENPS